MRMSVFFCWSAVRGPAGVSDAVSSIERIQADGLFQVTQFTFRATNFEIVVLVNDCDSRRVVASIFKLAQTVQNQRHNLLVSYITDYSTHSSPKGPRSIYKLLILATFQIFLDFCRNSGDQRVRRHILNNDSTSRSHSAMTYADRGDQHRV